jgi:hypothetical protein
VAGLGVEGELGDVHGCPFGGDGLILGSQSRGRPETARLGPIGYERRRVYSWRSAVVTSWVASRRATAPDSRTSVRMVAVHGNGGS